MTTPAQIIAMVRYTLNDRGTNLRAEDAELLIYVNDGIQMLSRARPELFKTHGVLTCTEDECLQEVEFEDAQALVEVVDVIGGDMITRADFKTLSLFQPGWRSDTAAEAVHWDAIEGDPLRFWIWPKSPADQEIGLFYIFNPPAYTLVDELPLPAWVNPALADWVIFRAESKDDESVNENRAVVFAKLFTDKTSGT